MIKNFLLMLGLTAGLPCLSQISKSHSDLVSVIDLSAVADRPVCDTVISHGDYSIRVIKENDKVSHIGLNLFPNEMKSSIDAELLEYIETSLLRKCLGLKTESLDNLSVIEGTTDDFRNITPATPHSVISNNSRSMTVEWNLDGRNVKVELPVGYQTTKDGTRSDIEEDFIAGVKRTVSSRFRKPVIDSVALEPYGEVLYILPGGSYMNKDITDSVYLDSDGEAITPVWNTTYPVESIANLFIYPSNLYGGQKVNVTVLKHQYGEKETFTVTVDQLLAYAEKTGCQPFWGVERFENGLLEGSLFLYNPTQGYDHIFKVTCTPADVIGGAGEIEARASLFVPTNNVQNLYAPYEKKSEDKKIKYEKNNK
ncbi:MAG: hypothetical protein K2H47_12050 [Muribaculaceae bacterium]|nr:hypothetical protein [Muribaculaceae bacterium]